VASGHFGEVYCDHLTEDDDDFDPDFDYRDGGPDSESIGYAEGPMMNYAWPLDLTTGQLESAAAELVDLPLCPVEMEDGTTYLALTGGGMDLSWEIAEAFIRCGSMPPFRLDLPAMAGKHRDPDWQAIVTACERTADIMAGWATSQKERLARLRVSLAEDAAS
jgi:hypothetical protein